MSSLAETDTLKECAICLDCSTELVHCCPCQSENDLVTCETCLTEYIHIRLAELVPFVCPQLPCPCHANTLLDFDLLEAAVSESLLHKYENTAGLALQFRCGSCHVSDSISVPFNPISCDDATGTTLDEWSNYLYADAFAKYKSGHMSIDAFYTRVKIWCKGLAYDDAWRDFSTILGSIRNPERRNALHLRYLRDHPIFETRCCSAPHCFQCKVYGAHSDRSCEEMAATFDPSTLSCIGCGITLVKGDGCDHVTCICGFDFGFSQELQHFLNADMFRKEYPLSTSLHCVSVLCAGDDRGRGDRGGGSGRGGRIRGRGRGGSRGSESSSLAAAMGWRHRHQFEVGSNWRLAIGIALTESRWTRSWRRGGSWRTRCTRTSAASSSPDKAR